MYNGIMLNYLKILLFFREILHKNYIRGRYFDCRYFMLYFKTINNNSLNVGLMFISKGRCCKYTMRVAHTRLPSEIYPFKVGFLIEDRKSNITNNSV